MLIEEIFLLFKAVLIGLVGLDERRWISSKEWPWTVDFVTDIEIIFHLAPRLRWSMLRKVKFLFAFGNEALEGRR